MSVVQVEAFDLPLFPEGVSPFVLRDEEGRLLVDPLLLGVSRDAVYLHAFDEADDEPLVYHFGNVPFADLDWLMPLYRPDKTVFPIEQKKMEKLIKRYCLDCVANLQGQVVAVLFLEGY